MRMVPLVPDTTKVLFAYVTSKRRFDAPEVLEVHVVPSGEVRIVPEPVELSPTTTNVLFP